MQQLSSKKNWARREEAPSAAPAIETRLPPQPDFGEPASSRSLSDRTIIVLPALSEDTNNSTLLPETRLEALTDFLRTYGSAETEPITPCSFPNFSFQSPDGKLLFSSFALFLKYVDSAPTRIHELETALRKAGLKFDHLTPFVECDFYVPNLYEALKGKGDLKQKREIYSALRTICEQEWGDVPSTGKMFHQKHFDWNRQAMSLLQVRGKPGINGFIAGVFSVFSLFEALYGLRSRTKLGGIARARVCAELNRLAAHEARAAWQADKTSPARAKAHSDGKKVIILPELDRANSPQIYEALGQALEHFLRDYGSAESAPITPLSFANFRFESRSGNFSFSSFGMFLHSISAHGGEVSTPLSELSAAVKKNGFKAKHLESFSRYSFYVPNLYRAMTIPENHPDARQEIYRALQTIVEQKWGDSLPSPKELRLGLDWQHVTSLGDTTEGSEACLSDANSVVRRFCTIYGLPTSRGRAQVIRMLQRLADEEASNKPKVATEKRPEVVIFRELDNFEDPNVRAAAAYSALREFLLERGRNQKKGITPLSFPGVSFQDSSFRTRARSFAELLRLASNGAPALSKLRELLESTKCYCGHLPGNIDANYYVPPFKKQFLSSPDGPKARSRAHIALRTICLQAFEDPAPSGKLLKTLKDHRVTDLRGDRFLGTTLPTDTVESVIGKFISVFRVWETENERSNCTLYDLTSAKLKELEQQRRDAVSMKTSVPASTPAPPPTPEKQLETTLAASPPPLFRALTSLGWEKNAARAYIAFSKRLSNR